MNHHESCVAILNVEHGWVRLLRGRTYPYLIETEHI